MINMKFGSPEQIPINNNEAERIEPSEKNNESKQEKKINRRDFLKISALAAISSAFGLTKLSKLIDERDEETKEDKAKKEVEDLRTELKVEDIGNELRENSQEKKESFSSQLIESHKILKKNKEVFPPDLFTDDFLGSMIIEESKCRIKNRPSKKNNPNEKDDAFGYYQTRRPAIRDIPKFLQSMHKQKLIDYSGPIFLSDKEDEPTKKRIKKKYGDRILTEDQVETITKQLQENEELSIATGELYLMQLFNQYEIGKKEYRVGHKKKSRVILCAANHDGPTKIRSRGMVPISDDVLKYIDGISNNKRMFPKVRKTMKNAGIDSENNNIATVITREMSFNPEWAINYLLEDIKKAQSSPEDDLSFVKLDIIYEKFVIKMKLLAERNKMEADKGKG